MYRCVSASHRGNRGSCSPTQLSWSPSSTTSAPGSERSTGRDGDVDGRRAPPPLAPLRPPPSPLDDCLLGGVDGIEDADDNEGEGEEERGAYLVGEVV